MIAFFYGFHFRISKEMQHNQNFSNESIPSDHCNHKVALSTRSDKSQKVFRLWTGTKAPHIVESEISRI